MEGNALTQRPSSPAHVQSSVRCSSEGPLAQHERHYLTSEENGPGVLGPHALAHLLEHRRGEVHVELRQCCRGQQEHVDAPVLTHRGPRLRRGPHPAKQLLQRGGGSILDVEAFKKLQRRAHERALDHIDHHLVKVRAAVAIEHEPLCRLRPAHSANLAQLAVDGGSPLVTPGGHGAKMGGLFDDRLEVLCGKGHVAVAGDQTESAAAQAPQTANVLREPGGVCYTRHAARLGREHDLLTLTGGGRNEGGDAQCTDESDIPNASPRAALGDEAKTANAPTARGQSVLVEQEFELMVAVQRKRQLLAPRRTLSSVGAQTVGAVHRVVSRYKNHRLAVTGPNCSVCGSDDHRPTESRVAQVHPRTPFVDEFHAAVIVVRVQAPTHAFIGYFSGDATLPSTIRMEANRRHVECDIRQVGGAV